MNDQNKTNPPTGGAIPVKPEPPAGGSIPTPQNPPPVVTEVADIPPPPIAETPQSANNATNAPTGGPADSTPPAGGPPVMVTSGGKPKNKGGKKKIIATILGLLLLVGSVGVGVALVQRNQDIRENATNNCGPDVCEPNLLQVGCETDGTKDEKLCIPSAQCRQSTCNGQEYFCVPSNGGFAWSRDDEGLCTAGTAQCLEVKVFDTEFNQLDTAGLAALNPGDSVVFTIAGTTTSGSIIGARFTINGTTRPVVTQKRPGTEEFMETVVLPEGTSLTVGAELQHSTAGFF